MFKCCLNFGFKQFLFWSKQRYGAHRFVISWPNENGEMDCGPNSLVFFARFNHRHS